MPTSTFHCSVVTPERAVLETEARSVVFPAHDGEVGIMAGHAPLLSQLGTGSLRVTAGDGTTTELFVDGGFAQVVDDRLTILTEQAEKAAEIDRVQAEEALVAARAVEDMEARRQAVEKARAKLAAAPPAER